jgi:hypothetical protein
MVSDHSTRDPRLSPGYSLIEKTTINMKNIRCAIILLFGIALQQQVLAQTINWNREPVSRNTIGVSVGLEHGAVFGISYARGINHKLFPMLANIEYSFPSGANLFDDFKIKVGGQIRWLQLGDVQFSTKLHGVIRRYENDNVRIVNFGSDFSGVLGYYRSKWFAAGEFGFDKSIISHYKHGKAYTEQYPGVSNGWYGPSNGGNFYYGFQAGYMMGDHELTIRAGKLIDQYWNTAPTVPYYGQLGYNVYF